ncbi:MAG: NAD-dependent epimerase/dehydratase family protein [Ardenticatenales bacterium]|nr:NAD-dependent epimerase/dehydratase family protein [Ardenticatenales bacterium]
MKILVTGGAGFIGSHIVDSFLAVGHEVLVADNLSTGRAENINPQARFYQVDIRDPELDSLIEQERPEVVSHQAARANVREAMQNPLLYAEVNVLGSLSLLESCRRHGVRKVIYASTGGATYGEPECLPVPETHPVNPLDPYGASKHHVEHYLFLYRANFGIDYTILRYPNVYGPRQDPYGEGGVIATFLGHMSAGTPPVINGSGEQERDFVYVQDIARANLCALERGGGGLYNIGSGRGTTINEIYATLARLTDYSQPPVHGPAKPGEVFRSYLDSTRANEELDWHMAIALEEGLLRTYEYFRCTISPLKATEPGAIL